MVHLEKKHGKYIWWVWDWFLVFGTNKCRSGFVKALIWTLASVEGQTQYESEPMLNHYLFWKQSQAKRQTLGEMIEKKQNSLATRDFSSSASFPGSFFPVMHFGSATVQSADVSPNFTLLRGKRMHLNHNNPLLEALCVSSFPWTRTRLLTKARLPLFPQLQRFHFWISWFRDFWSL